jgi:hypothetical protein
MTQRHIAFISFFSLSVFLKGNNQKIFLNIWNSENIFKHLNSIHQICIFNIFIVLKLIINIINNNYLIFLLNSNLFTFFQYEVSLYMVYDGWICITQHKKKRVIKCFNIVYTLEKETKVIIQLIRMQVVVIDRVDFCIFIYS